MRVKSYLYPHLDDYLLNSLFVGPTSFLMRPDLWIPFFAVLIVVSGSSFHWYWQSILVALTVPTVYYFIDMRRLGAKSKADYLKRSRRENFAPYIQRRLSSGQLADYIGEEEAVHLDRCAQYAMAIHINLNLIDKLNPEIKGYYDLTFDIYTAMRDGMNKAFLCFEPNLIGPAYPRAQPSGDVTAIERELALLADQVELWAISLRTPAGDWDASSLRARLKAMNDFDLDWKEGRLPAPEVELESEAQTRAVGRSGIS